jgi:hypothetical protein
MCDPPLLHPLNHGDDTNKVFILKIDKKKGGEREREWPKITV